MGKIALLVSREEMIHQAHNILQEKKYAIEEMRVIQTEHAVTEARNSIAGGASIIIARGLQASLIKQYTDIPVAEIVLTAQEMAILVMKAKQIVKTPQPVIAVVGFRNMFCDMSYFDTIYDIELRTYLAVQGTELENAAKKAVEDGVDLIIGGDTAVEVATKAGIASLFLSITEDSLRNAFSMAERMDYAMNVEKKNAAQMETLLDYSFNGIIRLDEQGIIAAVNPLMEDILELSEHQIVGKRIEEVLSDVDRDSIRQVLEEGKGSSLFLQVNHTSLFAALAPILMESETSGTQTDGAILTCHKMKKKQVTERSSASRVSFKNHVVLMQFGDILQLSQSMQECVRLAKLYGLSEKPVVITGEPGTEKESLAQSIHNSSLHGDGPFLDVPGEGLSDEEQKESIFGEKGAVMQANGGSLMIQDVDKLTSANQYRLYQLIRYKMCLGLTAFKRNSVDVRVMVTVSQPLEKLVREGGFRADLYYLLSGLVVRIPPLRERKEDLEAKIRECIKDSSDRYSRYHVLTKGAWNALMNYPWRGNLFQIECFCERLILTVGRRSVDEVMVNQLLRGMYPAISDDLESFQESDVPVGRRYDCEEAVRIRRTLEKHSGNRQETAKELGISKTTLWRRMKRFEIISL